MPHHYYSSRRTLKRPPLFGHGAAGNHAAALTKEKSLRQRRHTIGGNAIHNSSNSSRSRRSTRGRKDQGEGAPRQFSRDERETLKEQFLREIALEYEDDLETTKFEAREGEIEEEREEEEEEKEEGLARELEFQDALSGGSDEEMDVTQHSPAVSRRPVRDSVCVCVCNEADLWFPREHARLSNDGIYMYMYLHTLISPTPLCTDWHT